MKVFNVNRKHTWRILIFSIQHHILFHLLKNFFIPFFFFWSKTMSRIQVQNNCFPIKFLKFIKDDTTTNDWCKIIKLYILIFRCNKINMHLILLKSNFVLVFFSTWTNTPQQKTQKWLMKCYFHFGSFWLGRWYFGPILTEIWSL
jgi:hypothetical protein